MSEQSLNKFYASIGIEFSYRLSARRDPMIGYNTTLKHPDQLVNSGPFKFKETFGSGEALDFFNMSSTVPIEILQDPDLLRFHFKNLVYAGDKEVIDIQKNLVKIIANDIFELYRIFDEDADGLVLHSGTEANRVALELAKKNSGGKKKYVLTTNLSHNSIKEEAKRQGLELLVADVEPCASSGSVAWQVNNNRLEKIVEKYEDNIVAVVSTMGTTQLGNNELLMYHPAIEKLAKKGAWIHIDAAYGGTYFNLQPKNENNFTSPTMKYVRSITADTHKFIGVLDCGVLLLPNPDDKKLLGREADYFEGHTTALGTTRSSFPAVVALRTMQAYGLKGLQDLAVQCYQKAQYIANRLNDNGIRSIVPVQSSIVPISLNSKKEVMYMREHLLREGFAVSPVNIKGTNSLGQKYDTYGIRIVATPKPEMGYENINRFVDATIKTYWNMKQPLSQ